MKYLTGITLLILIFSSHAFACEKENKSASVLNIESTKTTQAEATSVSEKNLVAEESSFADEVNKAVVEKK